jgi:NitT/TauT family transport system permease protein
VSVALAVLLWQLVGSRYSYVVSNPSAVLHAYPKIFMTQGVPAFGRTSQGMGIGFAICVVFGVPIGVLVGRSRLAYLMLEPYVVMLFSIPFVALFPVLILVDGINLKFRVSCIVLAGIFPIIINTARGVRLVSQDYLDVGRSMVAGRIRTITSIVLPGSSRFMFAGIRVGFARAMIGSVVVEIEAMPNGVGFILHRYTEQFELQDYFAIVIVLGFFALFFTNLMSIAERWTLEPWRRRRSVARLNDVSPVAALAVSVTSGTISPWYRIGRVFSALSHVVTMISQKMAGVLRNRWVAWLVRILTLLLIIVVWNWRAENTSRAVLSSPKAVVESMWSLLVTHRQMWGPIGISFEILVVGFIVSLAVGLPVGILMGRSRLAEKALDPYVAFLYALPHAVFIPVMVHWLSFRFKFAVAYVFVSAVFPVIINTMSGVKGTDPDLIDTGTSFCASERKIRSSIVIPSAIPMMLTGARVAFSASWVGTIVAEILTTNTGLGGDIQYYSDEFKTPAMYASIVVIMVIAVILLQLSVGMERRLTPWLTPTSVDG